MNHSYRERILRSIGIFTERDIERLKSKRVAVAGLGLGGTVFLNLVRLGIERFHIADPDTFDRTNVNRQRLAKETTIGRRKDDCSREEARAINPDVQIKVFPEGVKSRNLESFLENVDWVVDAVDVFAMEDKLALNEGARSRGIPVASCATVGFSGTVVVFDKTTPSFRELTGISGDLSPAENLRRFAQFICPEVPQYMQESLRKALEGGGFVPFIAPGGEIAAAFAAAEIAKHITGMGRRVLAPKGILIDSFELKTEIFTAQHEARVLPFARPKQRSAA